MELVKEDNHSAGPEFILLGFQRCPWFQTFLFVMFLVIYMITVLGNTILVLIIAADSHLHTPIYFFLMNLSLIDLCNSSSIAPRAMVSFLAGSKHISSNGCATQFFFVTLFITCEGFLIAVMACDRYTDICNPLRYHIIMSKLVCVQLVVGSYISGCVNAMMQTGFTVTLEFCGSNEMDHFFCDGPPLISILCSEKFVSYLVVFILCVLIITSTALIVFFAHIYIIYIIFRIRSAEGRCKVFSTCTSHMMVVTLPYGTTALMYAQPMRLAFIYPRKAVSVFYTIFIPMLNPLICSLRNKDVKYVLRRTMGKKSLKKNIFF